MFNYKNCYRYHYVYKTVNIINNKYYIGIHSTDKLKDDYLGSGTILQKAIKKYGRENFRKEILCFYSTREELLKAEAEIVNESIIFDDKSYNVSLGGKSYIDSLMCSDYDKFIEFQSKSGNKGGPASYHSKTPEEKKDWHTRGGKRCHEVYKERGQTHPFLTKETREKSLKNRKVKGTIEMWNPTSIVYNKKLKGYNKGDCVRVYKNSDEYFKLRDNGWLNVKEKAEQLSSRSCKLWSTDSVDDHL